MGDLGVGMNRRNVVKGQPRRAGILAAVLAGAALAASGCTGSTGAPVAGPTSGATRQATAAASPTSAPGATVARQGPGTVTAKPDFPPAVAPAKLEHGGTYWGVYVTVVRADDRQQVRPEDQPRIDAAEKSLTDLGYEPVTGGDINCDQGVREQLRLDAQRNYAAVRIYFAEQAQAQHFVTAYQPGVVGTAKTTLYCMD
jgi:hypothetical protein